MNPVMYVDTIRTGAEARTAGLTDYGEVFGTEIGEGDSDLIKRLRRRQYSSTNANPLTRLRLRILQYCRQIRDAQSQGSFLGYEMAEAELQQIISLFDKSIHRQYKHPVLFVLGFVMFSIRGHKSLSIAMNIAKRTNQNWIREVDVIRYYRHLRLHFHRHSTTTGNLQ